MRTSPETDQTFDFVGILDSCEESGVIAWVQSARADNLYVTPTHDCMRTLAKSRGNCTRFVSVEVDGKVCYATVPTAMKEESMLDDAEASSVFHFTAILLTSSLFSNSRMPNLCG